MNKTGFKWDVFISFANEDEPWAANMVRQWESLDLKVFFSRDSIKPGASWNPALEEALLASKHLVVVTTMASSTNAWVRQETDAWTNDAQKDADRLLIQMCLEHVTERRPFLQLRQRVDLTDSTLR